MKGIFLSILLYYSMFLSYDKSNPFLGKWHNVSKTSAIKEVVFFEDRNVKFSNDKYSLVQMYELSSNNSDKQSFSGYFKLINVGKLVKKSTVDLKMLENDLMEIVIDDQKLILKRY